MQPLESLLNTPSANDSFEANGATLNQSHGDAEFGRFMDNALTPPATKRERHLPTVVFVSRSSRAT